MSISDLTIDPVPPVSNYSVELTLPVTGEKIKPFNSKLDRTADRGHRFGKGMTLLEIPSEFVRTLL